MTTTVIQSVQLVVLARLLDPKAFGLMAIVTIVITFAQLFGDTGLSQALIQRKAPTRNELSSLYWTNIASGAAIFCLLLAVAPLIAKGFREPELRALLQVAGVVFLIVPFGLQFQALAQKLLRFRLLALSDMVGAFVSIVVAVTSAWTLDQGVWSLVWGLLAGTVTRTLILTGYGWNTSTRPRLHFSWGDLAGYLSFGLYNTGAMSANFFNLRVAQLLVGALLGAQALGYYSVAANLVLQPVQKLFPVLTQVAFPVFSQVQDDVERLRRGYLQIVRILMFSSAPLMIGVAAVAPTAVPLLLGPQWTEAIPLVQVLALYALLRSLGNANGSLLWARGRANWGFYWNVAMLAVVPPVVYIASLTGDVLYIAWALVAVQLLLSYFGYRMLLRRLIDIDLTTYLKTIGIPVILASVMSLPVVGIGIALAGAPDATRLTIQVAVGVASYILLMYMFQRSELRRIIRLALVRDR